MTAEQARMDTDRGPARTFYIASAFGNKRRVRKLAGELIKCGMAWEHDWTKHEQIGDPWGQTAHGYAVADILAVNRADVFVLLPPLDPGAYVELGARIGAGGMAYAVRCEDEMFCAHHYVIRYRTLAGLLRALSANAEAWAKEQKDGKGR